MSWERVPASREYVKTPIQSRSVSAMNDSTSRASSSVSPGKPAMKVGAHRRQFVEAPDALHHPVEAFPAPPTAHPFEDGRRDVLQRKIEVRGRSCRGRDLVDQSVGQTLRMQIHQAHPLDPSTDSRAARGGRRGRPRPMSRPHITESWLTSDSSADSGRSERPRLCFERVDRAGAELPAHQRDRAERTAAVASFGDLQYAHGARPKRSRGPRRSSRPSRPGRSGCRGRLKMRFVSVPAAAPSTISATSG